MGIGKGLRVLYTFAYNHTFTHRHAVQCPPLRLLTLTLPHFLTNIPALTYTLVYYGTHKILTSHTPSTLVPYT